MMITGIITIHSMMIISVARDYHNGEDIQQEEIERAELGDGACTQASFARLYMSFLDSLQQYMFDISLSFKLISMIEEGRKVLPPCVTWQMGTHPR